MLEVFSLLIVLVSSLIITRVATIALALTGLSEQSARFQARSALTGAGFTTSESERVVNHPVRRRIIMGLMLLGNTGLVLVASLTILLLGGGEQGGLKSLWQEISLLVSGLAVLYVVAKSRRVERVLGRWIERLLVRRTELATRDYASLLRLGGEYRIVELTVQDCDWLADRSLGELELAREGVLALGITRSDGRYLGAPRSDVRIHVGDVLLLYGRESTLAELDERRSGIGGELRHSEAISRQRRVADEENTAADGSDGSGDDGDLDGRDPSAEEGSGERRSDAPRKSSASA